MLDPILVSGIEAELRQYRVREARLREIEAELAEVSEHSRDVAHIGGTAPGDPTFRIVRDREQLRAEGDRLRRLVQRTQNALAAMTVEQRRVVEARYLDGLPPDLVQERLHLSRRQFYRLRGEALTVYAQIAGLVMPAA